MKGQKSVVVVEVPMIGPESGGIRFCMICQGPIFEGEHWRKIQRLGAGYEVGAHDSCLAARQAQRAEVHDATG